MAKLTN